MKRYIKVVIGCLILCTLVWGVGCFAKENHNKQNELTEINTESSVQDENIFHMNASDVSSASVKFYPPGNSAELDAEEIEQLINALTKIQKSDANDSYEDELIYGQTIVYTLQEKQHQIEIRVCGSYVVVDEIRYKIQDDVSEMLEALGNSIII